MPRLSNSILRRARYADPLLPLLLRACRDLSSARNELRWLREHVLTSRRACLTRRVWRQQLQQLCVERSRGRPLQYVLRNQPFGDLEIICRPGVLIPRPETEAYTTHLATSICARITKPPFLDTCPLWLSRLRILDLCTGTGCIPLLLHAMLSTRIKDLVLYGIDISSNAIALANQNLRWNVGHTNLPQVANKQIRFSQGDIFGDIPILRESFDIIVSNPPYISPRGFTRDTARSVRKFEPKTALVPPEPVVMSYIGGDALERDIAIGDAFYPRLLEVAENVRAKLLLVEVADMEQAKRVATLAVKGGHWDECEIWRDWPDQGVTFRPDTLRIEGKLVKVVGEGHGRSVFLSRTGGVESLGSGGESKH